MNPTLRNLIKEVRKKKGLKQKDIAKQMGVKDNTISNWENGVSEPSIDDFVALCKICEVDFKSLLAKAYGEAVEPRHSIECTGEEADMIRKFRFLDRRAQKVILRNLNAEYEDAEKNLVEDTSIGVGAG